MPTDSDSSNETEAALPSRFRQYFRPRAAARKAASVFLFPDRAAARLDENEDRTTRLLDHLDRLQHQVEHLQHAIAHVNDKIDLVRKEAQPARSEVELLRKEVAALSASTATTGTDLSQLLQRVAEQQVDVQDQVRDLTELTREGSALHAAHASLAWQMASCNQPAPSTELPTVTVFVAVHQPTHRIVDALRSVAAQTLTQWRAVVVDSSGSDEIFPVLEPFLTDERFRYIRIDRSERTAGLNRALSEADSDLISYLDPDSTWHPDHLLRVADAFVREPDRVWSLSGRILAGGPTDADCVSPVAYRTNDVSEATFSGLSALSHRRHTGLAEAFDETLGPLGDWDLVLRLAETGPPIRIESTTTRSPRDLQAASAAGSQVMRHQIAAAHRGQPAEGLRVLFSEWHFPQVTETYVDAMMTALMRLGADVEAWAEVEGIWPGPTLVPVHRDSLEEAIETFQPDVVVSHWLHKGEQFLPAIRPSGLPLVVRNHGFDYNPERMVRLLEEPDVIVQTYDHMIPPSVRNHERLVVAPTFFDDVRYRPTLDKDPLMVLRTTAGLLTKDLETFLLAATHCPEHRFVLIIGRSMLVSERTDQLVAMAAEFGSPCEILIDLDHDEVAKYVNQAGIYLHTHGTAHPVTMPISIAESMATGAWVLARDLPSLGDYIAPTGSLYDGDTPETRAENAAALINESTKWSPEQWQQVWTEASESAYARFAAQDVVARIVEEWAQKLPTLRRQSQR